jgi:hypothetical protein
MSFDLWPTSQGKTDNIFGLNDQWDGPLKTSKYSPGTLMSLPTQTLNVQNINLLEWKQIQFYK